MQTIIQETATASLTFDVQADVFQTCRVRSRDTGGLMEE
jgi:hypothetical protein